MVSLLDPLSLKPGGYLIIENQATGEKQEFDTFTCCHCNRVVIKNPARERPRYICKKCMKWACDSVGCVVECRNLIETDGPLAHRDYLRQPWFLRDNLGYPVDRIYLPDGSDRLVRRNDNGYTTREMARSIVTDRTIVVSCTHCFDRFHLPTGLPVEQNSCSRCKRIICPRESCRSSCRYEVTNGSIR